VKALLEKLIPWMQEREYPFFLTTEASVNLAEDEKLLESMRVAGFKRVFLGIETPSTESLKETQKYQNTRSDLAALVHRINEHGMEVTAGFIVGFDSDTEDIFDRQIAIPNTQLWRRLEKEERLQGYANGDQFGRPNFKTKLDPDVLYQGYLRILSTIYNPDNYYNRVLSVLDRHQKANLPNLHEKNYPVLKVLFLTIMSTLLLGVKAPYRAAFWRFYFQILKNYRRQYVQGLVNAIVGHHFIRYTSEIMARQGNLVPEKIFKPVPQANSEIPETETNVAPSAN
jgi:hypothetical protein